MPVSTGHVDQQLLLRRYCLSSNNIAQLTTHLTMPRKKPRFNSLKKLVCIVLPSHCGDESLTRRRMSARTGRDGHCTPFRS
jgi:hypothetical protein